MELRRGLMMAMASVPGLIFHKSIVMDSMATMNARKTIQGVACENAGIIVSIDQLPNQPDQNIYIALFYGKFYDPVENPGSTTSILRPNGTYGTDNAMVSFTPSTGVIELGGNYGYFPAGTRYNIYEIKIKD